MLDGILASPCAFVQEFVLMVQLVQIALMHMSKQHEGKMKKVSDRPAMTDDEFMYLFQAGVCFISMTLVACMVFTGLTAPF
jgi:hypothetical protein